MAENDVFVHVEGDVRGQLVIGHHNAVVTAEGSFVYVAASKDRPKPVRKDGVELLPRRGTTPVGRDRELGEIAAAVADREILQVHGPPGMGKSTLLRHAARRLRGAPGGVVHLNGADTGPEDLAQKIFEACYDAPGYLPTPVAMRELMNGVAPHVLIDDLDATAETAAELFDRAPDACFVVGSAEQTLWEHRVLALDGLGRQDARTLLARAAGRALQAGDAATADALWEATGGNPLQLVRAGGAARTNGGVLPQPAQLPELLSSLLAGLDASERDAVAVLALAGDGGIADSLLPRLAPDIEDSTAALERLGTLGVLLRQGDAHRLASGVRDALPPEAWPTDTEIERIARTLHEWAADPGLPPTSLAAHTTLVVTVIEASVRAGRPELGARLAKAAAPGVACALRTGAWARVLAAGRHAAEKAGDQRILAYLTHEDGVRALVTGRHAAAAAALTAAAALWTRLGDPGAAALTDHAQGLLPSVPAPLPASDPVTTGADLLSAPPASAPVKASTMAGKAAAVAKTCGVVAGLTGVGLAGVAVADKVRGNDDRRRVVKVGALAVSPDRLAFDAVVGGAVPRGRLGFTNTGKQAVKLPPTVLTGRGFKTSKSDDGCGGRTLAPRQGCSVIVSFQPRAAGTTAGALKVRVGQDARDIPLRGTAVAAPLAGRFPFTRKVTPQQCTLEASGDCDTVSTAATAVLARRGNLPIRPDPRCTALPCAYMVAGSGWARSKVTPAGGGHLLDPADLSTTFRSLARSYDSEAEIAVSRIVLTRRGKGLHMDVHLTGRLLGRQGSVVLRCEYGAPAGL
ncbi:hypothetical protein ACQEU3_23335 [Spirillospora sp. CA-253888]